MMYWRREKLKMTLTFKLEKREASKDRILQANFLQKEFNAVSKLFSYNEM